MSCFGISHIVTANIFRKAQHILPQFCRLKKLRTAAKRSNPPNNIVSVGKVCGKKQHPVRQYLKAFGTKFLHQPPLKGRMDLSLDLIRWRKDSVSAKIRRLDCSFLKGFLQTQFSHTHQLKQTKVLSLTAPSPEIPASPLKYQIIRFYCPYRFAFGRK